VSAALAAAELVEGLKAHWLLHGTKAGSQAVLHLVPQVRLRHNHSLVPVHAVKRRMRGDPVPTTRRQA
jgi:hypothetical protein